MSEPTKHCLRCHGQPAAPSEAPGSTCPECGRPLLAEAKPPRVSRGRNLPFWVAFLLPAFLLVVGAALASMVNPEYAAGVSMVGCLLLPLTCPYCAWCLSQQQVMKLPARIVLVVIMAIGLAILNIAIGAVGCTILSN